MTYVIVGGVAGGASAAARLRRVDEYADIIILERGNYVSFANCGLPYHIGGVIRERESLLVQTREELSRTFNLDIRVRHEVVSINREARELVVRKLDSGEEYPLSYDRLMLSPGAEPLRPPIPGIDDPRILTLRSLDDMDRIISAIDTYQVNRAVVVGAGFIGIEIAENLKHRGIGVSVVEKLNQVLAPMDFEIAAQVHQHMAQYNVGLYLENGVKEFQQKNDQLSVLLEDGTSLFADMVILSIGVRPETQLARDAGLAIGRTGGIKVNSQMQSSDEYIYAVGDAVEVSHIVHGREALIPLAWPANRQGRLAADNMAGVKQRSYRGSLGTSILQVFDLTVGSTGLNEKMLCQLELPYETVTVNRMQHAGYYPGALPMTLKVIFSLEGEIYGAQGIGYEGVDKRIDLVASAIKGGMKVWDLQDLEVAYAPPYNSAKDPVNIAGYAAENILEGQVEKISYHQVAEMLSRPGVRALDVRTPEEHLGGSIPGSLNINVDELRDRLEELDRDTTYLIYCEVGHRGYLASRMLTQRGFKAVNLDGGYALWYPTTLSQQHEVIADPSNR